MKNLTTIIAAARALGASDLHIEPGLPVTARIKGVLKPLEVTLDAAATHALAVALLPQDAWDAFVVRRSADLSQVVERVRCRINVLHSGRGVGLAVRLLASFEPTLDLLNLHPDVARLTAANHGLILITGPTGSGKSSTAAAMLHHINTTLARHIVTLEQPVEYVLRPRQSFIRQREVGRDTPSFEQGLLDALREDPDVILVGEMRDPQTMRLTLNMAETGHLVLATMHSATCAEALQRMVSAFPSEIQPGVCAQLADSFTALVAQRLVNHGNLRVPALEVLKPSSGARAMVRAGQFFKLQSVLESGAADGQWTFPRYQEWMEQKSHWAQPPAVEPATLGAMDALALAEPQPAPRSQRATKPVVAAWSPPTLAPSPKAAPTPAEAAPERVLILDGALEDDPADILAALERKQK